VVPICSCLPPAMVCQQGLLKAVHAWGLSAVAPLLQCLGLHCATACYGVLSEAVTGRLLLRVQLYAGWLIVSGVHSWMLFCKLLPVGPAAADYCKLLVCDCNLLLEWMHDFCLYRARAGAQCHRRCI
jgi:hypothetical protein